MKVTVADAAAIDLRSIGKLFEIVGATKLKARSEVYDGDKLLSWVYSKSLPMTWDYTSVPERLNVLWQILRLSRQFNFVSKNSDLIAFLMRITGGPNKESSTCVYTSDFCWYHPKMRVQTATFRRHLVSISTLLQHSCVDSNVIC